jgi:hypothetical protein
MSDDPYEVGYGKPPKAHRWKKGQSGNPDGSSRRVRTRKRSSKSASFDDILMDEIARPVRVREGNRTKDITALEAALRTLHIEGLKGNRLALQNYIKLGQETLQRNAGKILDAYETALDYKNNYPEVARRREARGLPPPLPHPDDIVLDRTTGQVLITGPLDTQERQTLIQLLKAQSLVQNAIKVQREDIEECMRQDLPPDSTQLKMIERFDELLQDISSKFAERGWLPRLATEAIEKFQE